MGYDDDHTPKDLRETWVFRYKPDEVLSAARKKLKYHGERWEWWTKQSDEAEQQLKDKGFEYRSTQHTRGHNVEIVGDPQLAQRLTQCQAKAERHKEKQDLYESWERALAAKAQREPQEDLDLKIGDVFFFGL